VNISNISNSEKAEKEIIKKLLDPKYREKP